MTKRLNSLNLVGDGDEVDLVRDIERSFSITIEDHEAGPVMTVGELYDLVQRKRPGSTSPTTACFSQLAFHRLRRAMREMGLGDDIRPSTPLAELIAARSRGELQSRWAELGRRSGLQLPDLEAPETEALAVFDGRIGSLIIVFAVVAAFVAMGPWAIAAIAATVLAFAIVQHLRRTIPHRVVTVGQLCEETAGRSFGPLFDEKRSCHPKDVWFAVAWLCRDLSCFPGVIDRDTTFFAEHARSS